MGQYQGQERRREGGREENEGIEVSHKTKLSKLCGRREEGRKGGREKGSAQQTTKHLDIRFLELFVLEQPLPKTGVVLLLLQ